MKHFSTPDFWRHYDALPEEIKALADKNFALLKANPSHPSIRFKKVGINWSARVGLYYRALGKAREEGVLWTWIGHHSEYDKML